MGVENYGSDSNTYLMSTCCFILYRAPPKWTDIKRVSGCWGTLLNPRLNRKSILVGTTHLAAPWILEVSFWKCLLESCASSRLVACLKEQYDHFLFDGVFNDADQGAQIHPIVFEVEESLICGWSLTSWSGWVISQRSNVKLPIISKLARYLNHWQTLACWDQRLYRCLFEGTRKTRLELVNANHSEHLLLMEKATLIHQRCTSSIWNCTMLHTTIFPKKPQKKFTICIFSLDNQSQKPDLQTENSVPGTLASSFDLKANLRFTSDGIGLNSWHALCPAACENLRIWDVPTLKYPYHLTACWSKRSTAGLEM